MEHRPRRDRRLGPRAVGEILWAAIDATSRDDCPMLAAGLAFYTLLSFAPLVVIVLNLATAVVDPDRAAAYVEGEAGSIIGAAGAAQVHAILATAAESSPEGRWASIASGVAVTVGSMTVLVQLQRALNRVWQVRRVSGVDLTAFLTKRLVSIAMIAVFTVVLIASVGSSATLAAASSWLSGWVPPALGTPTSTLADLGVSLVVFAALFTAMFKFLPDARIPWRDVWFGGALTSVLFVLGKILLGRFLGVSAVATLYGAAGSLAIVLVWVYYTALLFLFGAEVTRAWSAHFAEAPVEPEPFAEVDPAPRVP